MTLHQQFVLYERFVLKKVQYQQELLLNFITDWICFILAPLSIKGSNQIVWFWKVIHRLFGKTVYKTEMAVR